MFKKGIRGIKVLVCTAITINVLTYFNGSKIKIPFKEKINLQEIKTSSYLYRKGASS
jgi:hypothetical protein